MQLTIAKKDLLDGLRIVAPAISSRTSLPVLKGILLDTETPGDLRLIATDLELGLEYRVPYAAAIGGEGREAVTGSKLIELVAGVESDVSISTNGDGKLTVAAGRASYHLQRFDAATFPELPALNDDAVEAKVNAVVLHDALTRILFAASKDATRPHITGVLVSVRDGFLTLAATDTHRINVVQIPMETPGDGRDLIVPKNTLALLKDRIDPKALGAEVTIRLDRNQIEFVNERLRIVSRTIEGQFPNWTRVVPDAGVATCRWTVAADELRSALTRLRVLVKDADNFGLAKERVILAADDDSLVLTAEVVEVGNAREEVALDAEGGLGGDAKIGFNAEFLRQLLAVVDGTVTFHLTGGLAPALLTATAAPNARFVVMPMQIQ